MQSFTSLALNQSEAAAADLGVGFGFVLLTLASLVHRVILVVKLERQRRIRALQDAERAIQRHEMKHCWLRIFSYKQNFPKNK